MKKEKTIKGKSKKTSLKDAEKTNDITITIENLNNISKSLDELSNNIHNLITNLLK